MADDDTGQVKKADTPPLPVGGPIKVKLVRKPIQAHDELLNVITFREPTVSDIVSTGIPATWAWEVSGGTPVPKVSIDAGRMTDMMVLLAAVPPSSIRKMDPRDWANCANSIAHFFLPDLVEMDQS